MSAVVTSSKAREENSQVDLSHSTSANQTSLIQEPQALVVYSTMRPGQMDIKLISGKTEKTLISNSSLNYNPIFSKDGLWMIYTSEISGIASLYAYELGEEQATPRRLIQGDCFMDAAELSPDGRTLYFVATRDGTADIYSMPFSPYRELTIDDAVNLTKGSGSHFNPSISPDGEWIAFCSNRHNPTSDYIGALPPENYKAGNIYRMRADGTQLERLTFSENWDGSPVWSNDGAKIYYYSQNDGHSRIWQVDVAGKETSPVTREGVDAYSPAISSDGRLAFSAKEIGSERWCVMTMSENGEEERFETGFTDDYYAPAFNHATREMAVTAMPLPINQSPVKVVSNRKPDGKGSFLINKSQATLPGGTLLDIYAIRGLFPAFNPATQLVTYYEDMGHPLVSSKLDGTDKRTIYNLEKGMGFGLSASKDHQWFVTAIGLPFQGAQAVVDIWKFSADGMNSHNLTQSSGGNNSWPAVMPDDRVVFNSTRAGGKNIFVMNSDGSEVVQLTTGIWTNTMAAVSPKGNKIIFSSAREGGNFNLFMIKVKKDGTFSREERLTASADSHTHPSFSPDGKWIFYSSKDFGLFDETPLNPIFNPQPDGQVVAMRLKDKRVVPISQTKWEDSLSQCSTIS